MDNDNNNDKAENESAQVNDGAVPAELEPDKDTNEEVQPDIGEEDEDTASWDPKAETRTLSPEDLDKIAAESADVVREILKYFPKVKDPTIESRVEEGSVWVDIEGDPSGRLIGRRGQTIDAFQHLLSKIMSHKLRRRITIHVDAEKYRKRQLTKLKKLALQTAEYVASTGTARALEPMSPADRRIVHITLRDREDVITMSEGRHPNRFVVVWPNTDQEEGR